MKSFARWLLFTPLLLGGCDVVLTLFSVPAQATTGSVATVVIAGNITGNTGAAGCVLQLPIGWSILTVANDQNWPVYRDEPGLLATYVAEPGHYLAAFSGTGSSSGRTLSSIALTLSVFIPVNAAPGQYSLKVSLAGGTVSAWMIEQPAGIAQFASITAAPYARPIVVTPNPAAFGLDTAGLPGETLTSGAWRGVALGDVDRDGRDDLAAVSAGSGLRCWLSRPGPGTTWAESSAGIGMSAFTYQSKANVAFGDLDGDGFLDLVDGNGHVCFNYAGTGWLLGAPLPLPGQPIDYSGVALGDVDGDGLTDIAIGAATNGTLQVLLNNGNRTFRNASAGLPAGTPNDPAANVILADLDGDGDLDLMWTNVWAPDLWLGDGHGGWTPAVGIPTQTPVQLTAAAFGDLDGDGVPEIVVGEQGGIQGPNVKAYKHIVGNSWAVLPVAGLPTNVSCSSLALLDFDRDGLLDLVVAGTTPFVAVGLWRNTGSGFVLDTNSGLLGGNSTAALIVGDFDGNTFPDVAIATTGDSNQAIPATLRTWQNLRTGTAPFGAGCSGTSTAAPQLVAIGLPQRGNNAFAMQVQEPLPGAIALFWFGGSRTFAPPFVLPFDATPYGAPGCTLYASLDYTFFGLIDAGGSYTVSLPVPTDPTLALMTAFSQGAVLAPGANAFGAVFTRAMALRIQ